MKYVLAPKPTILAIGDSILNMDSFIPFKVKDAAGNIRTVVQRPILVSAGHASDPNAVVPSGLAELFTKEDNKQVKPVGNAFYIDGIEYSRIEQ